MTAGYAILGLRYDLVSIAFIDRICLKGGPFDWTDEMSEAKAPAARPLSPHLSVYRLTLSMAMSIVHRITGAALYFGTLLLVWWLLAAAWGHDAYTAFQSAASSVIGRLVLFGYTWALLHHMLGGLRYLIWDTGRGFGAAEREFMVRATLAGSITLTIILWVVSYLMGGLR
jgi:succinate dehydrogenase / fumarate reductase, cytochrome b subunit